MSEPVSIYEWISEKKKKAGEAEKQKHLKTSTTNVNADEEAKKQFANPKPRKEPKDAQAEANKQFTKKKEPKEKETSTKKKDEHLSKNSSDPGEDTSSKKSLILAKSELLASSTNETPSSPRKEGHKSSILDAFASKKKEEKGFVDSAGETGNDKQGEETFNIAFEIAEEEVDEEQFNASNYQSANPRLEKVYKMALKPNETCVGKLLLVYRRKDTDEETEASHMITIRQPDGLRSFYINEATKSKLYRDKNGEVELHACGQWAFDVEKVGVKTIKAEK